MSIEEQIVRTAENIAEPDASRCVQRTYEAVFPEHAVLLDDIMSGHSPIMLNYNVKLLKSNIFVTSRVPRVGAICVLGVGGSTTDGHIGIVKEFNVRTKTLILIEGSGNTKCRLLDFKVKKMGYYVLNFIHVNVGI